MNKQNRQNFRSRTLLFLCIISIFLMTGCTITGSDDYIQSKVVKEVKKQCPEDFELISAKEISNTSRTMEYTFETTERKLTFTALSTVILNIPNVKCNYAEAVQSLYYNRLREELLHFPKFKYIDVDDNPDFLGDLAVTSYADLEEAAEIFEKCNQIYAEELQYNSKEFLKQNPAAELKFTWYPSKNQTQSHAHGNEICAVNIDGCGTAEEFLASSSLVYAQLCKDNPMLDSSDIPPEYLGQTHASNLKIMLNHTELDSSHFGDCWYNPKLNSYMINLFVNDSSLLLCEYMDLLHSDYFFSSNRTSLEWNTSNDTWKLQQKKDRNGNIIRNGMEIRKNGEKIPNIIETRNQGYVLVSIPVDDFASMLDLKYTISEKGLSISFSNTDSRNND